MNCTALDLLFPVKTYGTIHDASSFILNGLPTVVTSTLFIFLLMIRQTRKRILPLVLTNFIGFVCIGVLDLLYWRMFEIMKCNNSDDLEAYKFLVIIIAPIVLISLIALSSIRNWYRITSFVVLLFAYGMVVVDYYIRDRLVADAAQPIFPAQTFLCSLSLCCYFSGRLVLKGKTKNKTNSVHSTNSRTQDNWFQPHFMDPTSRHPTAPIPKNNSNNII
jgi:hypothetical protein